MGVVDQAQYGTCTANGMAAQIEHAMIRQGIKVYQHRSRSFLYYWSGKLEGQVTVLDNGRDPRDVLDAANKYGTPPESEWGYYPIVSVEEVPSAKADQDATRRLVTKGMMVDPTLSAVKTALTHGYGVGIATSVWSSFEGSQALGTGVCPLPVRGESLLGYHWMVIVGYADIAGLPGVPPGYFVVRNSWGTGVGLKGHWLLPEAWLTAIDPNGNPLTQELIAVETVTP
jgi:C1A family cysteine protease